MFLHFVPQVSKTFVPQGARPPEQRHPEVGVVLDVVGAVVRTVVRAIGGRIVVVVEHPRRGRQNELHPATGYGNATQFRMAEPFPKNLC